MTQGGLKGGNPGLSSFMGRGYAAVARMTGLHSLGLLVK